MKTQKNNIAGNLSSLRRLNRLSQEEVAGRIGVSRQTVAKWECGESIPDIVNCDALARLYDVELSDLIHHDPERTKMGIAPKGKHIFGTVRVGERARSYCPRPPGTYFRSGRGTCWSCWGTSRRSIRASR